MYTVLDAWISTTLLVCYIGSLLLARSAIKEMQCHPSAEALIYQIVIFTTIVVWLCFSTFSVH
jgi:hypothetical protein